MTFRELKDRDAFGAFRNYVTVKDAKTIGLIPEDFASYFEDNCSCGSERIISMNLKQMQCVDPKCPIKQALALHNMFSRFGCKGVGEEVCKQAYKGVTQMNARVVASGGEPLLKTSSYLEILLLHPNSFPMEFRTTVAGDTFILYRDYIVSKRLTFGELISQLGLPELETSAIKLFEGINSFEQLKDAIQSDGSISAFCERRGFYDPMKKFWLSQCLEDIYVASVIFSQSIRQMGLQNESICITGSIYPNGNRMTKKAFVEYCNMASYTKPLKDIISEVLQECAADNFSADVVTAFMQEIGVKDAAFLEDKISKKDLQDVIASTDVLNNPVQLFEIHMSTAKMSAVHIIADAPSNTDKYRTGLLRGVERDPDGVERKVLITSDEYLEEIERRKQVWIENYKATLLKILTPSKQKVLTEMNLV